MSDSDSPLSVTIQSSGFLNYSKSIGDQKISDELISGRIRAQYTFKNKFQQIDDLISETHQSYTINLRLHNAEIRFQPLPGQIYYLYETPKDWISILGPKDWTREGLVGGFRYNWDGVWEEMNL